jgi:hypothetical protein
MIRRFISKERRTRTRMFENNLFIKQADDSEGVRGIDQNEFSLINERKKGRTSFHHRMINIMYKNV